MSSAGYAEPVPAVASASSAGIRARLADGTRWRAIRVVAQTGSTNADLLAPGTADGTVLVAEHQTGGRGRFDRSWLDSPGTAISLSVLIRPRRKPADWGWLSLLTGLSVVLGLRTLAGSSDRAQVKWPNDVLLDDRKVCGVLCETAPGPAAVLGMGVNVSMSESELPVPTATSLLLAGLPTDKDAVIGAVLVQLDQLLRRWEAGDDLRPEYLAACSTIGRRVQLQWDAEQHSPALVTGVAVGIDRAGALLVDDGNSVRSFAAGDVIHLR